MKEIILHMSKSSYGDAELIDSWHKERGFRKIGYHFVILNGKKKSSKDYNQSIDGKVETGRDLLEKGAHCKGHNNSIGICFIGMSGDFSENQMISCFYKLKELKDKYGQIIVKQHSDYDPVNKPDCAGFTEKQMEKFNEIYI